MAALVAETTRNLYRESASLFRLPSKGKDIARTMGKKTDRIEELEAELSANREVLRHIGDQIGITLEIRGGADSYRAKIMIDHVLAELRAGRVPVATLRTDHGSPMRQESPASRPAPQAWDTFDDHVDEAIDRLDAQGLTKPRDTAMTVVKDGELAAAGQFVSPIVTAIAQELGLNVSESTDAEALGAVHEELVRIKNMGADIEAQGATSLISKGDSLADAVAHVRSQSSDLREGATQARAILGRLAAVMQVSQWDADGTELLERAQRYENWKHALKRRIKELRHQEPTMVTRDAEEAVLSPVTVDELRRQLIEAKASIQSHIADELKAHLAQLMSPKEMATWIKAMERPSLDRYADVQSTPVPPYPVSFDGDDVRLIADSLPSAEPNPFGRDADRLLKVIDTLRDLQESRVATGEFVRAMNLVVLPILARQRAAKAIPDTGTP